MATLLLPSSSSIVLLFICLAFPCCCNCLVDRDIMLANQSMSDGQYLISSQGAFRFGFFTPPGNTLGHRYAGIWYNLKGDLTVVWVANRESPVKDRSGTLTLHPTGELVLADGRNTVLWSSGGAATGGDYRVKLWDVGKLDIATQGNNDLQLWDSSQDVTDTLTRANRVGFDLRTRREYNLTCWKSGSDPSPGSFSLVPEDARFQQGVVMNGSVRYWRTGPWLGLRFIGLPDMTASYLNGFTMNRDSEEVAFMFAQPQGPPVRMVIDSQGVFSYLVWVDAAGGGWTRVWWKPQDPCDIYGVCGENAVCNPSSVPMCRCLQGFQPRYGDRWKMGYWSGGCLRRTPVECAAAHPPRETAVGFFPLKNIKVPDYVDGLNNASTLVDCQSWCLGNCSCVAWTFVEDNCMVWTGELLDIKEFDRGGELLNVKISTSDLVVDRKKQGRFSNWKIVAITAAITVGIILCWSVFLCCRGKARKWNGDEYFSGSSTTMLPLPLTSSIDSSHSDVKFQDFQAFDFETISSATNDFSLANKVGEGGFGPVYKGVLGRDQEIAVKRLSANSKQGLAEFKNEVMLISKLQHRNLVRLLGYCIEGEERTLIYEFLPNKSLDLLLFGKMIQKKLNWSKRFHIIKGIAQGLFYLHHGSRIKIIHRDLKASNILLDDQLNPKISDFGTARIFGESQCEEQTRRIIGTYGYMSPEYAMHGQFSEKSDIFSFGVLVLEIISGRKITSYIGESSLNLLGYAWKLWSEKCVAGLVDAVVGNSWPCSDVTKCIHIALLSIQELPEDRPTMSLILSMLEGDIANFPEPKKPTFIGREEFLLGYEKVHIEGALSTVNGVTLTELHGR